MKLFRRISALALAVVMICLLSVSAFATSPPYNYTQSYSSGSESCFVQASAEIDRYYTTGTLTLVCYDAVGLDLRMDIVVKYYPNGENANMVTEYYNRTTAEYTDTFYYEKTGIFALYSAKYTFWAAVPTPYGMDEFDPDPVTLRY